MTMTGLCRQILLPISIEGFQFSFDSKVGKENDKNSKRKGKKLHNAEASPCMELAHRAPHTIKQWIGQSNLETRHSLATCAPTQTQSLSKSRVLHTRLLINRETLVLFWCRS